MLILMKLLLSTIFLLMLTACESKQLTELQSKLNELEALVLKTTEQRNILNEKMSALRMQLESLQGENP
jgi:hypothetical protein